MNCSKYLLSFSFLAVSAAAFATDRIVPFAYPTIQAAINASFSGDRVLLQPTTFNERISFNGKDITVKAYTDQGAIIDGGAGGPVVTFAGTEPSTAQLSGITIQNGLNSNGGGIKGNFTIATIKNCIIRNNKATGSGGGIYGFSGLMQGCQILSNEAANGGGVAASEGILLANTIGLNEATSAGGGIYNSIGTIQSNLISSNTAGTDGGGVANLTTGSLIFNTITLNTAAVHGGGVYNVSMDIAGNTITSNQVTVTGSTASPGSFGAGLCNCSGRITGNYIAENAGNGRGGGLDNCTNDIINNVVFSNGARLGGGLSNCTGNIFNNTIFGNLAIVSSGGMLNCSSPVNCIIWDNSPINPQITGPNPPNFCCVQNWSGGGTGNILLPPQVVDAVNGDMHLQAGSPCIDAGTSLALVLIDFEGDIRGTVGTAIAGGDGSRWDIGADEFVPPFVNLIDTWGTVTPKLKGAGPTLKYSVKGTLAVGNSGNVPVTATAAVNFYLSTDGTFDSTDTTIGKTLKLKPLKVGATKTLKLKGKLPTGQSASGLYLLGVVDSTNVVAENNEADNVAVSGPLP
ncbi:MAG: CARDB domain-containing protein [Candidatus Sumerlaeaceae bacterium]